MAKRQTLSPPRQKDVDQAVVLPVNLLGKSLITLYLDSISVGNCETLIKIRTESDMHVLCVYF